MKPIKISKSTNQRVDKFLADKNPGIPRRFFQQEIKKGTILVNSKKASQSYKLKTSDEINFQQTFSNFQQPQIDLSPDDSICFSVLFQNENFAIIEKPAGISVHPSPKELSKTLVNGLLAKFPNIKMVGEDPTRPGIVHRLDKFTSGLLIIALSQDSFDFFKKKFKNRTIQKKYIAVCHGKFKQKKGCVDSFIGKSKSNQTKQSTSKTSTKIINPKEARTDYLVLKEGSDKSLVELSPKTGRKHQIRVHMHSLGHPLVGDFLYENKIVQKKNKGLSRFFLHASQIEFSDQKGVPQKFVSAPPDEFEKILHQKNLGSNQDSLLFLF